MAESNFGTPPLSPFFMPTPTGTHAQGSPTSPPRLTFAEYTSTWSADYHHFPPNQPGAQMPDPTQTHSGPFHYLHQSRVSQYHQFSNPGGPRAPAYYSPPVGMFPHGLSSIPPQAPAPAPAPAPGHYNSPQVSSGPRSSLVENRSNVNLLPIIEPNMPSNHAHNLPSYSQLSQPQIYGFSTFQGRHAGPALPTPPTPPSGRFGEDAMQPVLQGRGSSRGAHSGTPHSPRVVSPPSRRPSYDRQHQNILQAPGGSDRRPQLFLGAHSRRSDRSVSPRTSHRRSFDRYATDLDLPQSSGSSDAEAALRARSHRARQQRQRAMLGGPDFRRAYAVVDSNSPTPTQLQVLKDKLRHFLPSQLPEGSSTSCDICQKDFSTKHVLPTEEDEVAIQLPCKHVFGEYCFDKWVETCKTHKNKITCPMCRKLLVEPVQRNPAGLFAMPEVMALFSRPGSLSQLSQLSQLSPADRQILERAMEPLGPVEGDVAHI